MAEVDQDVRALGSVPDPRPRGVGAVDLGDRGAITAGVGRIAPGVTAEVGSLGSDGANDDHDLLAGCERRGGIGGQGAEGEDRPECEHREDSNGARERPLGAFFCNRQNSCLLPARHRTWACDDGGLVPRHDSALQTKAGHARAGGRARTRSDRVSRSETSGWETRRGDDRVCRGGRRSVIEPVFWGLGGRARVCQMQAGMRPPSHAPVSDRPSVLRSNHPSGPTDRARTFGGFARQSAMLRAGPAPQAACGRSLQERT